MRGSGVGRRQFLKFASVALGTTTAQLSSPGNAVTINGDYYLNRRLCFGFKKPTNWHLLSAADFGIIKENMHYGNFNAEIETEIKSYMEEPLALLSTSPSVKQSAISKRLFGQARAKPNISVNAELYDEYTSGHTDKSYFKDSMDACTRIYTNARLVGKPTSSYLSKCRAWSQTWTYTAEQHEGESVNTICHSTVSYSRNYIYTIHMQQYDDSDLKAKLGFKEFLDSVCIL